MNFVRRMDGEELEIDICPAVVFCSAAMIEMWFKASGVVQVGRSKSGKPKAMKLRKPRSKDMQICKDGGELQKTTNSGNVAH